jgi:hypothetical protein
LVKGEIEAQDTEEYPWRSALFNSNCGDPYTFNTVPKDKTTTIADNRDFAVMYSRRLLLPINPMSEKRVCPACLVTSDKRVRESNRFVLDPYGNHCAHCPKALSGARTSAWHDPVVRVLGDILKMAGLKVKFEEANVLVIGPPGLRADLVASMPGGSKQIIIDVRTADPCTAENVKRSAQIPGHAACQAEILKKKKWGHFVNAQGDLFVGFAVEAGGALGDGAKSLLDLAACANGSSTAEIAAFTTYALQRIHITTQLGVARTIRANFPIPTGARLLHLPGAIDLGDATPRSRICQPLAQGFFNRTISQQQQQQTHAAQTTAAATGAPPAALLAPLPSPHNTTARP